MILILFRRRISLFFFIFFIIIILFRIIFLLEFKVSCHINILIQIDPEIFGNNIMILILFHRYYNIWQCLLYFPVDFSLRFLDCIFRHKMASISILPSSSTNRYRRLKFKRIIRIRYMITFIKRRDKI
jgi:hypothetical protein